MSKSFVITSTGFKGDAPPGGQTYLQSAVIVPVLPNVSCSVKRGPPALGFLAVGGADIVRERYTTSCSDERLLFATLIVCANGYVFVEADM